MTSRLGNPSVPPLALFIGERVRILTNLKEDFGDDESEAGQISVIGQIVDTDEMYLTLGYFDDSGAISPQMAIKHADIQLVKLFNEEEERTESNSSKNSDSSLN